MRLLLVLQFGFAQTEAKQISLLDAALQVIKDNVTYNYTYPKLWSLKITEII